MTFPVVSRGAIATEVLFWIEARNRSTGALETMGLWTGMDVRTFTVEGTARQYSGAGAVLDVPAIQSQAGLSIQMQSAALNILTPEVEQLIRGYDARQAPVEVHLALFDPDTNALLSISRVFKGWLDQAPIKDGAKGGTSSLSASLASNARILTRTVPLRVSEAGHRRAYPNDRWFRYIDVSGSVPVWWGQKKRGGGGGKSSSNTGPNTHFIGRDGS